MRTPSGSRMRFVQKKNSKSECALCQGILHGVPHSRTTAERRALSKSSRRPSALFAGVLCGNCRETVLEECAKVKSGVKPLEDVSLALKPYIRQIENKVMV